MIDRMLIQWNNSEPW